MNPSISHWERRDYKQKPDHFWRTIALILWVGAIATWLYVLTPTVRAENELNYRDVHTEAEACAWLHAHPDRVTNVKWCDL